MQFPQVKQALAEIFSAIQAQALLGELPSEKGVNELLRLSSRMLAMAEDDWLGECEDFHHLIKELLQVVKKGSAEDAIQIVEALDAAQAYCHEKFRL
jgi:XXXCH domain-containing protein